MAVKDFNPEAGDSASTMGIVDILLECVELSYRAGLLVRLPDVSLILYGINHVFLVYVYIC